MADHVFSMDKHTDFRPWVQVPEPKKKRKKEKKKKRKKRLLRRDLLPLPGNGQQTA